jgi:hypothetical protein
MTEDEQSSTLAFLQNFYTGVTLYMPFEADEQPVEAAIPTPAAPAWLQWALALLPPLLQAVLPG